MAGVPQPLSALPSASPPPAPASDGASGALQADLFGLPPTAAAPAQVLPAAVDEALAATALALQQRFGDRLHLGTSSWHFPGWAGLVWRQAHAAPQLSRHGLPAYAAHPLLRAVSLDRAFYRALDAAQYAALAAQVPPHFRFVVKAPALVTDAQLRQGDGVPTAPNPQFLSPQAALALAAQPAADGLGTRLGVLVFQLSPLPARWLRDPPALHRQLAALFDAVRPALPATALLALELRDAALLTPALAALLKAHGVRYALGLHDRMPPAADQLPMLRATWPGNLVCRWNLQAGQRYAQARDAWAPFDRLVAPDGATRQALARAVAGTLAAGWRAFVTINNKAEGSAPLSVRALAEEILRQAG